MASDPRDLELSLRNLTPAQEKAWRLAYGIGCERPHTRREILEEFKTKHQYSHRRTTEVIRQATAELRRILGDEYKNTVAELRGLQSLIHLPNREELARVRLATQALIDDDRLDPAVMLAFSSRQFEELVASIWNRFGYEVELTARTRDGGRDVIAIRKAEADVRYLIECKRYDRHRKVGVRFVRALHGVKCDENATKAILATTATFTRDATAFFARHRWELEPRDFDGILRWIQMARAYQYQQKSDLWVPDPGSI